MKRLWNWLLMWGEWWPEDHKEGGRDSSEDEDAGGKREAERERERVRGGGLIDNLHPLQRISRDMIESSQAEPIRGALLLEAEQKSIDRHPGPALHRDAFIFMQTWVIEGEEWAGDEEREEERKEEWNRPGPTIHLPCVSWHRSLHLCATDLICMWFSRGSICL